MLIYLRVLKESFNFAINALVNNKLRTFLSLLGVTIGIFSIIGILAAVDSLKREIEGSLSGLDNRMLIVARFSFGPTEIPRWRREQFPDVNYEEYQYISRSMNNAEAVSYVMNVPPESIRYEDKTVANVQIGATTHEYYDIEALQLETGRFFNESESTSGTPVVILGNQIATSLFGSIDPIGKTVRLYGRKFSVIGVLKKEGAGLFGNSKDSSIFLPVNVTRRIFGDNNRSTFPQLVIMPEKGVDAAEFIAVLKQRLRTSRGLKPDQEDTFFVNQLKGFTDLIDNLTSQMNIMGLVISGFSLLVGGFGIANIMFVSVKERTNLIGIQKSLGAKNKFILFQFLFEAVILAVIGGLVGLLLVWIVSIFASMFTGDFQFVLSAKNMFIGTAVSAIIGLISGIIPAISASKLDPVEAIRTGM
ncbi:MAG: ABC transporter permease [Flavobacteriaceae bacterium CG_4_8_14_3_um_filter_34_10]|nr:FtsX-like permease family protein [Flavobacteriia bacterium]OIP51091.1 MAG: ABC transporter permease [Flavobacteriaceae bacterium CG2_30_34_30]PIQ16920.1 MAG: ABC transporter permease [Flavobacteriaceae bacterium CG18_big_fil_WC_8_21_14_2_50_34_36]PIV49252.1 MAG: ABC transporter permease [Flavobacteriaceae bacterium CG02_land_8_20_14_3_00_34_13]PIX08618.1 MAG: ABC transporter permease [Flavobacteriaceae bacterium CG_4_8_14_3_um_filter_34_10]PIZ07468.1 MAG: ABC transporter permease [Flavobac